MDFQDSYCYIFFDNYINSPIAIQKLHEQRLHGLATVQSRRKHMPEMKKDEEMKPSDYQIKYYNNTACIKWMDNKSVMHLRSNIDDKNQCYKKAQGLGNKSVSNQDL